MYPVCVDNAKLDHLTKCHDIYIIAFLSNTNWPLTHLWDCKVLAKQQFLGMGARQTMFETVHTCTDVCNIDSEEVKFCQCMFNFFFCAFFKGKFSVMHVTFVFLFNPYKQWIIFLFFLEYDAILKHCRGERTKAIYVVAFSFSFIQRHAI